jgi:hypothetical protein
MPKIWVADTEPNDRFTLYTRGNVERSSHG